MPVGRPRKFNPDEVLDHAIQVFWRRGFRGTSLNELARELGIEKPSLYAAFGNKEQLFLKALDRYASGFGRRAVLLLQQTPSGKAAIEALLSAFATQLADADSPAGCMIANCAVECRELSESINRELVGRLEAIEQALLDRLKRARKEGELARAEDVRVLARYFATVLQGMIALSRIEHDAKELRNIVKIALRAWPQPAAAVAQKTR